MRETFPKGGHGLYDRLVGRPLAGFYGRLAERLPAGRVLDIGCGPGHLAEALRASGRDVVAVDKDPKQVQIASKNHPKLEVREGDVIDLPFEDGRFDLVVTSESYHHWVDQDAGVKEARRVLTAGGRFVVIEGCADVQKDEAKRFMGRQPFPGFTTLARAVFRNHGYSPEGLHKQVVPVLKRHFAEVNVERVDGWWVVTANVSQD